MAEFMIIPDRISPCPSPNPPSQPSHQLPSLWRCFLLLASLYIASGIFIDPVMAKHATAFNCEKATFGIDQNLTRLFRSNLAYTHTEHTHMPIFSFIHQTLREKEVLFGNDILGNKTENVVYVRHHQNIYYMKCKPELVTIIKTDKCFANQIKQVLDGNGEKNT